MKQIAKALAVSAILVASATSVLAQNPTPPKPAERIPVYVAPAGERQVPEGFTEPVNPEHWRAVRYITRVVKNDKWLRPVDQRDHAVIVIEFIDQSEQQNLSPGAFGRKPIYLARIRMTVGEFTRVIEGRSEGMFAMEQGALMNAEDQVSRWAIENYAKLVERYPK